MYKTELKKNKRISEEKIKIGNDIYDFVREEIELLPNGLVRVAYTWQEPEQDQYILNLRGCFVSIPRSIGMGKQIIWNGKSVTMPSTPGRHFKSMIGNNSHSIQFFPDHPSRNFTISGNAGEIAGINCLSFQGFRFELKETKERKLIFTIDIRKGVRKVVSDSMRGGIDFRLLDNLDMPDDSSRNLLVNPSFEQGFLGYTTLYGGNGYLYNKEKWETPIFILDNKEHVFGKNSLRIATILAPIKGEDYRHLASSVNLSSHHMPAEPGVYTASFYIKGTHPEEQVFNAWVCPYTDRYPDKFLAVKNGHLTLPVTKEWKRHKMTFHIDSPMPLSIRFNALSKQRRGFIWIDGIQIEKGNKMTDFDVKPVEAQLVTSDPDNFVSVSVPVNAKLKIHSVPNTTGNGTVIVHNFYREVVAKRKFTFRTDENGCAVVPLDLENIGKGIFMLRTDYVLSDGRKSYDLHRFAVMDFLENCHPLRILFSEAYGNSIEREYNFYRILERWKKIGIGSRAQICDPNPLIYKTNDKYGIQSSEDYLLRTWREKDKFHFGIRKDFSNNSRQYIKASPSAFFFRDFYLDSNGVLKQDYLKKIRESCEEIARKHPHINLWQFSNEITASFPFSWWSEEGSSKKWAEVYSQLLKPFIEGIKAGNPKAKVSADCPCNMTPTGGIQETADLLRACNKLGIKLDRLAIHPYRYSPESPDLDADTALYLKTVNELGYTKEPIFWSEMMHWGPYNIPTWRVESSRWNGIPETWVGGTISYDMGWTEKISAAWRARSWLVALKYSDRIKRACSSSEKNNFSMDLNLTPFATQAISNTLGHLLGDSKFKKDIRFAAYIRAYVFEDAQKRPVAAVWCHLPAVDEGRQEAPVAEVNFGDSLESVIDLMNNERAFESGKVKFAVTSFPLFFRGKTGTLDMMIKAFKNATILSGKNVSPLIVSANPGSAETANLQLKNLLSVPFEGNIGKMKVSIAESSSKTVSLPLPKPLRYDRITEEKLPIRIQNKKGGTVLLDLSFSGVLCKRISDSVSLKTIAWKDIPAIRLNTSKGKPALTSGIYRIAWNRKGFFIRAEIKDKNFSHIEFAKTASRWSNDSLQIYFDTYADARSRQSFGYDENDYDYLILPNSAGTSCSVYRLRMVDWQLALGTAQESAGTFAKDIPTRFTRTADGYVYEIFFPAKHILPIRLRKGYVFGLGVHAPNADDPKRISKRTVSSLTNSGNRTDCYNKPHLWPAVILVE